MASQVVEVISRTSCGRIPEPALLLEERVYPAEIMPDGALSFQVIARKCAYGQECQSAGIPCRWSGLNPNYDPL
jgi:hypothetical protein